MINLETRTAELRSEVKGNRITGYASIFNERALIQGTFWEVFVSTAFDAVLADPSADVRAFLDHDPGKLLGRQSSGTLRMAKDSTGLHFEVDLPDTSAARDARELMARGDLNEVSIQFVPGEGEGQRWDTYQGRRQWTHHSVARLVEISPVAIAAYSGTSVSLRAQDNNPIDLRTQIALAKVRAHQPKGK